MHGSKRHAAYQRVSALAATSCWISCAASLCSNWVVLLSVFGTIFASPLHPTPHFTPIMMTLPMMTTTTMIIIMVVTVVLLHPVLLLIFLMTTTTTTLILIDDGLSVEVIAILTFRRIAIYASYK
ncbi:hypothetical protein CUMW_180300 [Citrus unshiu]|nr:hypothetical protein CUMW_180300 [Citrus unshiu]